ncbi:MAG: efflux transporter outer membrane subunit [Marivibrio sp.]|uniref:efflux transporter outer membrane subunit n=1 Tax=Marivibrio sp. TaxID=2039719 RepID=UPI0032EE698C
MRRAAGLKAALMVAPLLLGGCWTGLPDWASWGEGPVGPDYVAPEQPDIPASYAAPRPDFLAGEAVEAGRWWTRFQDPLLDRLVARGLAENPDVLTADSRVREARALLRGARAAKRPTLDAEAEAGIEGRRAYADAERDEERALGGAFGLAAVFDWSLDLFGGMEREIQAAEADLRLIEAERRDAALGVAAEIARTYADLRGAQTRLALADESLALQRRSLQLVQGRVDSGLASDLDMARAEAELAALEADRAPIRTEIQRAAAALAVLTGSPPGALPDAVREAGAPPQISGGPPIGAPLDLLRQRPDLVAAEEALIRATAEIGVAEAELYPKFSLPGRIGLDLSDVFTGEMVTAIVGSLFLAIDAPLFDGGAQEAEVEAATERAEQALLAYRATLLGALQEVEGALEGYAGAARRVQSLEQAVTANRLAFTRAEQRYTQGLASFLDVLEAQRSLTDRRFDLADARTDLAREAIALYQAAGLAPAPDA